MCAAPGHTSGGPPSMRRAYGSCLDPSTPCWTEGQARIAGRVTHRLQPLRTLALSFVILTISAVAAAEQVRVVRDGATIWRQASATGGILTIVNAGTILEVDRHEGRWLIVHLSRAPAQRGYILEQQTE